MDPIIDEMDIGRPLRILLVEDNRADAYLLSTLIADTGIPSELTLVGDGEEAIRFMKDVLMGEDLSPDLVLLDINLPKRNGHEVLSFLRKEAGLTDLCVIVCSGSTSVEDREMAAENQANSFLIKPMVEEEMQNMVEDLKDIMVSLSSKIGPAF